MSKWDKVRLGDVCEVVSGTTPSTRNAALWNGGVKWITPAEIRDDSYYIYDTERYVSKKAGLRMLPKGTVLLSSRAPIGKVAIAGDEMCCNQGFKNLICTNRIHNRYLYHFLKGKSQYLNSLGRGATFKEISRSIVENIEIPLPALAFQCRIADVLDEASNLITQHYTLVEKLNLLVKSRFVEMFGDPIRNEKGFPLFTIEDVLTFQGGSQPNKKYFEYAPTENNIRLIQIRDYKTDQYKTYIPKAMARRFCSADDIMIGRYGPPIFQILSGIEGSFNVALMKAIPKKGNKDFIREFLKQKGLLQYLEGMSQRTAGQDGIQMDALKAYPFPYPPIELQDKFVEFSKQTEKSKFAIQRSLEELETLKKALMQQYFG